MIEQKTTTKYYCDDCGEEIFGKVEPKMYELKEMKISIMLCGSCKERLAKWCKR